MTFPGKYQFELELNYEVDIDPPDYGNTSGPPDSWVAPSGGHASLTRIFITRECGKAASGDQLYCDHEIPLEFFSEELIDEIETAAYEAWAESVAGGPEADEPFDDE